MLLCSSYLSHIQFFFCSLKHQWKPIWPNPWSHHPDSSSITTCHNRRREVALCWVWEWMWITELDRNTPWSQQTLLGVSEGLLVLKSIIKKKQLVLAKETRLTKAKSSWSRNGSRLDWCWGVEASHQETIEGYTGGDGYWREREKRNMLTAGEAESYSQKHFKYNASSCYLFHHPCINTSNEYRKMNCERRLGVRDRNY